MESWLGSPFVRCQCPIYVTSRHVTSRHVTSRHVTSRFVKCQCPIHDVRRYNGEEYDVSWTMPQCVLCLRLIGPALDNPLHCTALHCTALHCTALHCNVFRCTALHCTALQASPGTCMTGRGSAGAPAASRPTRWRVLGVLECWECRSVVVSLSVLPFRSDNRTGVRYRTTLKSLVEESPIWVPFQILWYDLS
jgi:hypothetical protein